MGETKFPELCFMWYPEEHNPGQWSRYITASTTIKLYNTSNTRIAEELRASIYINDKETRKGSLYRQTYCWKLADSIL